MRPPHLASTDAVPRRPSPRNDLITRSALLERLRHSTEARVVLVIAGAGFGKTNLLAQWAVDDDRPFAWLSLEDAHNDPTVLITDVVCALEAAERFGEDGVPEPAQDGEFRCTAV